MPEESKTEQGQPVRKSPHKRVEMATGIGPNVGCELLDVSTRGARLSVSDGWSVPDVFILALKPTLTRWVQVVWRTDHEVAVRFVAIPASQNAARDDTAI